MTLLAAPAATPYTLCPRGAPADLVCDPGVASAVDEVDGDLLSIGLVTVCGSTSYLTSVGLAGCTHVRLDTPGIYPILFAVTNSEVRLPSSYTARRCRQCCDTYCAHTALVDHRLALLCFRLATCYVIISLFMDVLSAQCMHAHPRSHQTMLLCASTLSGMS